MADVWIIPGALGSELTQKDAPKRNIWVDYPQLAVGGLAKMELDRTNGSNPASGADLMEFGPPLHEYYDKPAELLEEQLKGTQYQGVKLWGFDWRLDMRHEAARLAFDIKAEKSKDGVTLVCHSQGGIIARMAYKVLKASGDQGEIARVICVGTPHEGLFNSVNLFLGKNKTAWMIALLTSSIQSFVTTFPGRSLSRLEIMNIAASWPSFYQLLPNLKDKENGLDVYRQNIFDLGWYPDGLNLVHDWLRKAKDSESIDMSDPDTKPPGNKLICVAGKGWPTAWGVRQWDGKGKPDYDLKMTDKGDDSVTVRSATVQGAENHVVEGSHVILLEQEVTSGKVAKLIRTPFNFDAFPRTPAKADPAQLRYETMATPGGPRFNYKARQ